MTLLQLHRTKSSADAAARAAREAKAHILTFDAAFEMTRLKSALKETLRHLSDGGWASAIESISEAEVAIVRLTGLHDGFSLTEIQTVSEMGTQLSSLRSKISFSLTKGTKPISQAKALDVISNHHVTANQIGVKFEKQVK